MLVCVGACLVMIASAYGFNDVLSDHVVLDPSRVAAQVVSGIGFLGAGSILLRGSVIRGLTTAASDQVSPHEVEGLGERLTSLSFVREVKARRRADGRLTR
jgi:MgtC family